METNIQLTNCVGEAFYDVFWDIEENNHFEYWLGGGRGSLKTSFAFIVGIYKLMKDIMEGQVTHMIALRKIKETISTSVFNDALWALNMLGVRKYWNVTSSPMKMTCGDSSIIFTGCANQRDFEKIKGIKFEKGYLSHAIFEEVTEFVNYDEILSILQSLFRGSNQGFSVFTYNPSPNKNNWVNEEVRLSMPDRLVHFSNYLQAPKEWLGEIFLNKAETIKLLKPRQYAHMYMGEQIGEGLEIYPNVEIRSITDEEIRSFTQIKRGIDFGHVHATCYCETFFDEKKDIVYVFGEVYSPGLSNARLAQLVKEMAGTFLIRADNENPNMINELSILGLNIIKTRKGKGSKEQGIKWLGDRVKIVIDKRRCPNIASDFQLYEFKKNKDGKKILEFPDEPDGSASVRYSLEDIIQAKEIIFVDRR